MTLAPSVYIHNLTVGFGLMLCASACGPSDSDFTEFSKFISPDGKQYVVIDSAHSVLAYGPETLRIYVSVEGSSTVTHVVTTKIANDGAGISDKNVRAEWVNHDILRLCLTGVEQEDYVLEVDIRKVSYIEKTQNCSI